MNSWLARTRDRSSDAVASEWRSRFSGISELYEVSGVRHRVPLAVAILSVAFQEFPLWVQSPVKVLLNSRPVLDLYGAGLLFCSFLAVFARTSRLAVAIFIVIAAIAILPDWIIIANHTYLALWCIPLAILFREWWTSEPYALYLRVTLGIVMLAAFTQKVIAGTYVDGTYIAFLSAHGGRTERLFSFLCDANSDVPCIFHRLIAIFILGWQLTVGILLLLGLNSLVFLAIEIGFLLAAGIYADEMNFQILNIALLCIVFRFGMPLWLLGISVAFLVVGYLRIDRIVTLVLNYVT